jgi:amidase
VAGLPTRFGSRAVASRIARSHGAVTKELLAQGFAILGKTRLPEFGLSPSTEPEQGEPTRNPWNPAYSSGGSSGGSAALVAAGVVPIAHGNDGGGSIRIPASCCGLVGLKLTRGRIVIGEAARMMPVSIVSEGVLTRTVRDTAHFVAGIERRRRSRWLPSVGLVEGPSQTRLRIGVVLDSINDLRSCSETRQAVERVARVLEKLGHRVEPLVPPVPLSFLDDFKLYWAFLAFTVARFGKASFPGFDPTKLERFTSGLARYYERRFSRTPLAMARLRVSSVQYARTFRRYDAVLSPVLAHTVPKVGHLHPEVPFEELFERILKFTAFTPLNNAAGSPALALPASLSSAGLPLGVQLSSAHGAERTLLELAYELEAELRFPSLAQTRPGDA